MRKNDGVEILKNIAKLEPIEFLGICNILGIEIYKNKSAFLHNDKDSVAKEFDELWNELCDKVEKLDRRKRRNLGRLVRAANKRGN